MTETIIAWLSGCTLGVVAVSAFVLVQTAATAARVERKLDALLRHSGVDLASLATREAEALMKAGRKIDAIKAYRELTGAGLAEAKAAVEQMG